MTTDSAIPAAATKPRTRAAKTKEAMPPPTAAKSTTKSDTVVKLLLRAKGATPIELIAATDWQPHSLRAFLAGLRKKGRVIVREERKGGGCAYRIVVAPSPPATTAVSEPPAGAASDTPDNATEA
jgi:hypothetical protein